MELGSSSFWGTAAELARSASVYVADLDVTGLAAFGATSGNPLLYNGSGPSLATTPNKVLAVILGLSMGWTTAPGASGVVCLGIGTTAAPTSTGAATAVINTNPLGGSPQCSAYNSGTVTAATGFIATHQVSTSTSQPSAPVWTPLDGMIVLPPGCFVNVSGVLAISTMVAKMSLVWAEIPI